MSVKIQITMDVDGDYADPGHKMGVSEAGYDAITGALAEFGENIDVQAAEAQS